MRKIKIFSVILLIISTIAYIAFQGYIRMVQDNVPPVITCSDDELTVSVTAAEEELMSGVKAEDNRSGDVSATLVIEDISAFTEDGVRIITYAAVDESMNVGRCERTLIYEDYQPPVFKMSAPLCFTEGQNVDILSCVSAESVLDGSLKSNIKYSLENTVNSTVTGSYPVQFRVTDSCGKTIYLDTVIEILDRSYAAIDVRLSSYLVYVEKGAGFDPNAYYSGADVEGALTVNSTVDTSTPGTYYVDYIMNSNGLAGKSRLVVVVQ